MINNDILTNRPPPSCQGYSAPHLSQATLDWPRRGLTHAPVCPQVEEDLEQGDSNFAATP